MNTNKQILEIKKEKLANFEKSMSGENFANNARKNVLQSTHNQFKKDIADLEEKIAKENCSSLFLVK